MKFSRVKTITKQNPEQTYDITIENDHCFFGNNILTHNCGYRGELLIHLFNNDDKIPWTYGIGEKIAQLVVVPCWTGQPEKVNSLDDTERGEGRMGSTGDKVIEIDERTRGLINLGGHLSGDIEPGDTVKYLTECEDALQPKFETRDNW